MAIIAGKSRAIEVRETVALPPLGKDDPTDLEEIASWACIILVGGGFAVALVIGLVALAFWAR